MHNPTKIDFPSSSTSPTVNNEAIQMAIDDLKSQEVPNVNATAQKYNLVQSTLQRRYNSDTVARF